MTGAGSAERIVIINDFSTPRGGATTLALELALQVARRGRSVVFFAGDDGRNDELLEAGVRVVSLGGRKLLADGPDAFWRGVYNPDARERLEALIDEEAPKGAVFHLHGWAQIFSPSIFAALDRVASRTAVTCHDFFLACPNGNFTVYPKEKPCTLTPMSFACVACDCDKRNYAQKLWRVARQVRLKRLLASGRDRYRYLTIHAGMIPMLSKGGLPAERMLTTPNPVDPPAGPRITAEENDEILYIGRLEPEKGADLAAAAARQAGLPFRAIGEGGDRETIRRANPDTIFDGWRRRQDLPASLARARLVVAPSRCVEPFGLAAVEALSAGAPVIASNTLLISKDIESREMGVAIDPTDIDAFADLLSSLRSDRARVKRMSENAYAGAGAIASTYDQWISAHLKIYDDLAASPLVEGEDTLGTDTASYDIRNPQPVATDAP